MISWMVSHPFIYRQSNRTYVIKNNQTCELVKLTEYGENWGRGQRRNNVIIFNVMFLGKI